MDIMYMRLFTGWVITCSILPGWGYRFCLLLAIRPCLTAPARKSQLLRSVVRKVRFGSCASRMFLTPNRLAGVCARFVKTDRNVIEQNTTTPNLHVGQCSPQKSMVFLRQRDNTWLPNESPISCAAMRLGDRALDARSAPVLLRATWVWLKIQELGLRRF